MGGNWNAAHECDVTRGWLELGSCLAKKVFDISDAAGCDICTRIWEEAKYGVMMVVLDLDIYAIRLIAR